MSKIPLSEAQAEELMAKQQMEEEKKSAMNEQKENYLRAFVSTEGRERLTRIAQVKPERAAAVEMHIIRGVQQGRLQPPISDDQVREFLTELAGSTESKGSIKIIRKNMDDDW